MLTFKAALFDLDGTLVDTEGQYTEIWGGISRKHRPDIPRLEYIIKGTTLTQILSTYFPDKEVQQEVVRELDEREQRMTFEFFPGALDFIHDIRSHGVKCAIVTSSDKKKMDIVRRQIPGFDSLFDRVLMSEDFAASKPNPDCYLRGAAAFGLDITECVVFEDAFTGLEAGMASGIYTIGITTGNSREQIQDKCDHVIDTFEGMHYEQVVELLNNKDN